MKEKKEYADLTYEQVSSWINNCDAKASILLALIGVILSIVFTNVFILGGITERINQVVNVFKEEASNSVCDITITYAILIILVLVLQLG